MLARLVCAAILSLGLQASAAEQAAQVPLKYLQREGRFVTVGGSRLPLVGVNRYELAGGPQAKVCQHWGGEQVWWTWAKKTIDDAAALGARVVRFWAFQNFAGESGTDFRAMDKVIAYARSKRIRLIPVLENQWNDCSDGGIKDAAWFTEGYKHPYGKYKLSFDQYVEAIVRRYQNEPTVAMWQILNEGKLYETPDVLAAFLDRMAKKIKSISPNHLVSGGGAIQCWQGRQGAVDFQKFSSSKFIDVLDFHDYDEDNTPWTSCGSDALQAAKNLGKPLIVGECGIKGSAKTAQARGNLFSAKLSAAAKQGAAGFLIWSLGTEEVGYAGFDFTRHSPTGKALTEAVRMWPRK